MTSFRFSICQNYSGSVILYSKGKIMTINERWNKTIRFEPADRLIFWPKLSSANLNRWRSSYGFKSLDDFFSYTGGDRLSGISSSVKEEYSHCRYETEQRGNRITNRIITPRGTLEEVNIHDEASAASHPVEFFVKSREDLKTLKYFFDDTEISVNEESVNRNKKHYAAEGENFFGWECVGESPLMDFIEYKAGVERGHFLLFDHREEVESLFESWHRVLKDKTQLACKHSPADMLFFVENTSTSLISPDQYRAYCYNHISDYSEICEKENRVLALHMCGLLKEILPELNRVGPKVFEAFTSPPVGNTSFPTGRGELPEICLIGGTNAALWMEDSSTIIAQLKEDLDALPHHRGIIVSSAGVMPPAADPDKIKEVSRWVRNYLL